MKIALKNFIALVLIILISSSSAQAETTELPECYSNDAVSVTISHVNKDQKPNNRSSDLITRLADNRQLLFANIKIAKNIEAQFLDQLLSNKTVLLHPSGRLKDRHNRLIRQVSKVVRDQESAPLWIQKDLVKNGLALVYASPSNYLCVAELLAAEKAAREAKTGEWREGGEFIIHDAADLKTLGHLQQGSFQIVRGKLHSVSIKNKTTYLNFSENWREDFTILIETRLLRRKDSRWPNLKALVGKTVLVRGWIDHWNGPMIRVDTPEMLSVE